MSKFDFHRKHEYVNQYESKERKGLDAEGIELDADATLFVEGWDAYRVKGGVRETFKRAEKKNIIDDSDIYYRGKSSDDYMTAELHATAYFKVMVESLDPAHIRMAVNTFVFQNLNTSLTDLSEWKAEVSLPDGKSIRFDLDDREMKKI